MAGRSYCFQIQCYRNGFSEVGGREKDQLSPQQPSVANRSLAIVYVYDVMHLCTMYMHVHIHMYMMHIMCMIHMHMIYMYVYVSCVFKAERFTVACCRIFLLNSSKCSINLKTKINKQVKTPKEKWRVIEEDP